MMRKWQEIIKHLNKNQEVALLVHEKPDGDCLGSALALGLYLQEIGYKPVLYLPEPISSLYKFLPGQEFIRVVTNGLLSDNSAFIAVDCADEERWSYQLPQNSILLNIDHHVSNTLFGEVSLVDSQAAATGEIIYRIITDEGGTITPEIATCLYVAISTDTGSFRYSNVTPTTFSIAGELVKAGADLDLIRQELFEKRPLTELLTMKKALETLSITAEGRIAAAYLSYEMLQEDEILDPDTDGLISLLRSTDGVELALIFKELESQVVKVSLRSKSYLDVNKLAQRFNGGGHPRAGGCTIKGQLDRVMKEVMAAAVQAIEEEIPSERSN